MTVPGGTIVEVSLVESISSANAQVGDQVAIRVTKEVDVGGWLVIPAGSPGHATVTSVDRAGSNGHGGQLALSIDWVFSQDGGRIVLSPTNHASENGQRTGAASTATILSYVFLGPIGLFAHNFVRGRDVTIDTDKVLTVFVDHDVLVATAAHATSPDAGFDRTPPPAFLRAFSLSEIAEATGLSLAACSRFRARVRVPPLWRRSGTVRMTQSFG